MRIIGIFCLSLLWSFYIYGQSCDCPAVNTCFTCEGGIKTLTLRYNGSTSQTISAADNQGVVFSQVVAPNATFSFSGSLPNDKFVGSSVDLTVGGTANATIPSNCGTVFVGNVYGSFTIVAANSKNGGPLCCSTTAQEKTPPQIANCPVNMSVNLPASSCKVQGGWLAPSATDNCALASFTSTHTPTDLLDIGVTTVKYTAVDSYNNQSTCTFTVAVVDNTQPVITGCPGNITVSAGNSCEAIATWTEPSASDNCSAIMSASNQPGDTFPLGVTKVTYTARDGSGNVATCSFNVTVTTDAAPTITGCSGDITLHTYEDAIAATWSVPTATAICGEVSSTASHQSGDQFGTGVTRVVYEFSDGTGNKSVCQFNVTVIKDEFNIEVSKALTPNGDGVNDTWILPDIEKFSDNTVNIVDRWGNKIYHGSGYDNTNVFWNGIGPGGARVPTGTYFYTIQVWVSERLIHSSGFVEVIY